MAYWEYLGRSKLIPIGSFFKASSCDCFVLSDEESAFVSGLLTDGRLATTSSRCSSLDTAVLFDDWLTDNSSMRSALNTAVVFGDRFVATKSVVKAWDKKMLRIVISS